MTTRRARRQRQPAATRREAAREATFDLLANQGIDDDDHLYRRITGERGQNLPAYQHEHMLRVASYLYRTNPVAHRLVSMLVDFVLGEGMTLTYRNAQVREVIERHWQDGYNDWERNAADLLTVYLVSGELLLPLFPNPLDGHLRVGCVVPEEVREVRPDPENWRVVREVRLRSFPGEEPRAYQIVNLREGADDLREIERPALFWKRQNPLGTRGISLLYTLADFIDLLDQMVFNEVERALLMKAFIWTVTVKDATARELAELAALPQYAQPPKPGAVMLQNERISWEAKTPRLDTYDAANLMRFLRNHIFGAVGIPVHWFAEGEDVNRASAQAMAEPVRKRMTSVQDEWRAIVGDVLRCQVDYAVLAGRLPAEVPEERGDGQLTGVMIPAGEAFRVEMPDLSPADTQQVVGALSTLTQTLALAVGEGYVSQDTARRLFLLMATQLGADIDLDEETAQLEPQEMPEGEPAVEAPVFPVARLRRDEPQPLDAVG
jgi:hypothetical protein